MKQPIALESASRVTLTTVYDNYPHHPELATGWGFGCVIKVDKRVILFDTGDNGELLLENMEKLKISPGLIDIVFLSHNHLDHTGGLNAFLRINSKVTVFLPPGFDQAAREEIQRTGCRCVDSLAPVAIFPAVSSTGELGTGIREQSLVVKTTKGLIVITGCAHPGILEVVKAAKAQTGEGVRLVIGGFHLKGNTEAEVISIIDSLKTLGVKKAAPCHCSGQRTRELFEQYYGEEYIKNGAGKTINIE